jgi:hypothetical protein
MFLHPLSYHFPILLQHCCNIVVRPLGLTLSISDADHIISDADLYIIRAVVVETAPSLQSFNAQDFLLLNALIFYLQYGAIPMQSLPFFKLIY